MTEKEHRFANKEKETSFKYSTAELGKRFEKESFMGDLSQFDNSQRQTGINLASILARKFPGKSEFTEADRNQIVKEMSLGELTFGYMSYMLHEEHPLVNNWPEENKREALNQILDMNIAKLYHRISTIIKEKVTRHVIVFGDLGTIAEAKREMLPYQNFQRDLFRRMNLSSKSTRK